MMRTNNIFRYRYVFGLFFAALVVLFVQNLVQYLQEPNKYLAAFLPGLHPDHFLHRLTGIEFLVIDFTILSFLLVFAFIALSFWYDRRTDRERKIVINTEILVIPIIIRHVYQDLLFVSDVLGKEKSHLKAQLKNRKTLEVFFITLVHFQDLVDEDLSERLQQLSLDMDVQKRIRYFLRSIKDSDVLLGLRVVRTLKAKEFLPDVNYYVQSRNAILRIDAMLTRLCITEQTDPEKLFFSHPYLSSLDINRILPELRKQLQKPEDLKPFLDSDNSRVNTLAIILLKERKDRSYLPQIKAMLQKPDAYLRSVIWDYLINIDDDAELYSYMALYWNETDKNKSKILSAMGRIKPNKIWTDFLDGVIRQEGASYRVQALEALFIQDAQHFVQYMDETDERIEKAYGEVINLVN